MGKMEVKETDCFGRRRGKKIYWGRYWWLEDTGEEGLVESKGWVGDGASTEIFLHKNLTQTSLPPLFNAQCLQFHCAWCQQRGCIHGGVESWGATGEQMRVGLDRKPRDGRRNTGRGARTWMEGEHSQLPYQQCWTGNWSTNSTKQFATLRESLQFLPSQWRRSKNLPYSISRWRGVT